MILETTYSSRENDEIINDLVGKQFTLLQMIKMKGIGSKRMIVDEVSPNLEPMINKVADLTYANMELRPNGVLIMINKGLRNFTWIIPYYHLVIYKTNGASIHAQGKYIRFRNDKTFKENKSFFNKLLNEKVKYDLQYDFI